MLAVRVAVRIPFRRPWAVAMTATSLAAALTADGGLIEQAWDLDGDGIFNDGFGPSASRAFRAGSPAVGLRVIDDEGSAAVRRRSGPSWQL